MTTSTLNQQFLATGSEDHGHEGKPAYKPGSATAKTIEPHKCNIKLGNEAIDSYHRKTCKDH
jgi:hypothetical protein